MVTGKDRKEKRAWRSGRLRFVAILAALAMVVTCFAGTAFAVDLGDCSLTITLATTDEDFAKDLEGTELTSDLYKVADAVPVSGYDTYSLEVAEGSTFAALKARVEAAAKMTEQAEARTEWLSLAQGAAGIVADGEDIKPTASGTVGAKIEELEAGLYLVITHGNEEDALSGDPLSGIARTATYEYKFQPQLISLPAKEGANDTFNTAQSSGDWINDFSIALKAERERREGSIRINKTLSDYNGNYVATFVFSVEAVLEEEVVYSNVFTLNFESAATKGVTVDGLPVGAEVTVTEVYDGAGYALAQGSAAVQTGEVDAVEITPFNFTNDPDGTVTGGRGILNSFTSDGSSWTWNSDYTADSSN